MPLPLPLPSFEVPAVALASESRRHLSCPLAYLRGRWVCFNLGRDPDTAYLPGLRRKQWGHPCLMYPSHLPFRPKNSERSWKPSSGTSCQSPVMYPPIQLQASRPSPSSLNQYVDPGKDVSRVPVHQTVPTRVPKYTKRGPSTKTIPNATLVYVLLRFGIDGQGCTKAIPKMLIACHCVLYHSMPNRIPKSCGLKRGFGEGSQRSRSDGAFI